MKMLQFIVESMVQRFFSPRQKKKKKNSQPQMETNTLFPISNGIYLTKSCFYSHLHHKNGFIWMPSWSVLFIFLHFKVFQHWIEKATTILQKRTMTHTKKAFVYICICRHVFAGTFGWLVAKFKMVTTLLVRFVFKWFVEFKNISFFTYHSQNINCVKVWECVLFVHCFEFVVIVFDVKHYLPSDLNWFYFEWNVCTFDIDSDFINEIANGNR